VLYPNGDELTYTYSQVEAPTGLSSSVSGSVVSAASYTPWGASSSMLTGSGAGQVNTVRVYDQASLRLDSLTSTVGAVDVVGYSFEFDDGGNLTLPTPGSAFPAARSISVTATTLSIVSPRRIRQPLLRVLGVVG